jgi:parallel beta-helix repeat protein
MISLRPHPLYPGAALAFALVAVLERPIAVRRPAPAEMRTTIQILVTSDKDTGYGSLRWAIFEADKAQGRVGIEIASAASFETLPPVLNPQGGAGAQEGAGSTDAAAGRSWTSTPGSVVGGLKAQGAADGHPGPLQGVALGATSQHEEVHVLAGAGAVSIEDSTFDQNGTGVGIEPGVPGVAIHDNLFRKHDRAAVWAVSPSPGRGSSGSVSILRNRFEEDRMSLVLIHVPARVEDNQILRSVEAAAYLTGAPVLLRNRVEAGASVGIYVDAADGAVLEENEVSNCLAVGILLRQSRNTELRRNRLFGNSYGIAVVLDRGGGPSVIADNLVLSQRVDGLFVVGASPVVQDNRILGNRQAGLRILDYIPLRGARLAGLPVVRGNVFKDNRWDELRGEYREPPEAKPRP